ncbi:TPA: hypothetical protein NH062_006783 [Pseudomonas aeruginosa]|nr:hypothetical protein [Pseudomonas aeruginosa]HCE9344666.1 hypothetical protein [Pseudomonas aeruginosa]
MLRTVSLGWPARVPMQAHSKGGLPEITLKKENGAAFTLPSASCEVIQAMGRGRTVECMILLRCSPLRSAIEKYMVFSSRFHHWIAGAPVVTHAPADSNGSAGRLANPANPLQFEASKRSKS